MSKVKMVVGLVVILFCLLGSVGYAQGELTLEGLAERVEALIKRVSLSDTRLSKLETRVATLESSLLSAEAEETPTPIAMKKGTATATAMTSEQTATTVDVGHVRWRILAAEHLGNQIEFEDETDTTLGGFVSVRFEFLNLSSDPLKFDGGYIRDGQEREYSAWPRRSRFVPDEEGCSGGGFLGLGDFRLKPNTPTICTVIYEVAGGASDFVFVATDLEGPRFDTVELIDLGLSETTVRAMSTAVATEREMRTATVAAAATQTAKAAATQTAKAAATRQAKAAKTATYTAEAAKTATRAAMASARIAKTSTAISAKIASTRDAKNATATIVANATATILALTPRPSTPTPYPTWDRIFVDVDCSGWEEAYCDLIDLLVFSDDAGGGWLAARAPVFRKYDLLLTRLAGLCPDSRIDIGYGVHEAINALNYYGDESLNRYEMMEHVLLYVKGSHYEAGTDCATVASALVVAMLFG